MPRIARHLFVDTSHLSYVLRFKDEAIGHHYSVDRGLNAAGLSELEFFLELDPKHFGGGPIVRAWSRLLASSALQPVHYAAESAGRRLEITFDASAIRARLPSGELVVAHQHEAGQAPVSFVLENNAIGHIALLCADLPSNFEGEHSWSVLYVGQLLVAPYSVRRAPELDRAGLRGLHSSLGEELWIDADGGLEALKHPAHAVSVERVRSSQSLPDWCHEPQSGSARAEPRYRAPASAAFEVRDVTIASPATPIGGALSVPRRPHALPAALFVAGSGRHDRHGFAGDIDIGTHELMDFLAEHGICGLRYDTRGAGSTKYGPNVLDEGLGTLIDDAATCLNYLGSQPEVDPRCLSLIGHSQGGNVALAIARSAPAVRCIVLLAVPGRPIDQVMADQVRGEGERRGLDRDQIQKQLEELDELFHFASTELDWSGDRVPPHIRARARSRRWLAEHLQFSADTLITQVRTPLLICQGAKDLQVSVERDAQRLYELARGVGVEAELRVYPELDHLFKPVSGAPSLDQYFVPDRHVDPGFMNDVASWISRRVET